MADSNGRSVSRRKQAITLLLKPEAKRTGEARLVPFIIVLLQELKGSHES
jgi:hypothetical protein